MSKIAVVFLEGWLLSSQSEQLKKLSRSSDWLEKANHPKKPLLFWTWNRLLACLHDQSKSGFFGGPAFFQSFLKPSQIALIGWINVGPPKSHFSIDHVNRLYIYRSEILFFRW